jgi:hypothetical protein
MFDTCDLLAAAAEGVVYSVFAFLVALFSWMSGLFYALAHAFS